MGLRVGTEGSGRGGSRGRRDGARSVGFLDGGRTRGRVVGEEERGRLCWCLGKGGSRLLRGRWVTAERCGGKVNGDELLRGRRRWVVGSSRVPRGRKVPFVSVRRLTRWRPRRPHRRHVVVLLGRLSVHHPPRSISSSARPRLAQHRIQLCLHLCLCSHPLMTITLDSRTVHRRRRLTHLTVSPPASMRSTRRCTSILASSKRAGRLGTSRLGTVPL